MTTPAVLFRTTNNSELIKSLREIVETFPNRVSITHQNGSDFAPVHIVVKYNKEEETFNTVTNKMKNIGSYDVAYDSAVETQYDVVVSKIENGKNQIISTLGTYSVFEPALDFYESSISKKNIIELLGENSNALLLISRTFCNPNKDGIKSVTLNISTLRSIQRDTQEALFSTFETL